METFYFNKEKKAFFLPTKEISFQKFFEEQKNKLNINEIENDDLENTELGNNIIIIGLIYIIMLIILNIILYFVFALEPFRLVFSV